MHLATTSFGPRAGRDPGGLTTACASALLLLVASDLMAQEPKPLGPEFQVNTQTTGQQGRSDVASFPDGSFVVVWSDGWGAAGETSIRAQRYAPGGSPVSGEFQVSTYTSYDPTLPRVDGAADGSFVVVWETSVGPEGGGLDISGQRFAADGSPQGGEFIVNSWTEGAQRAPAVASATDGSFVVAWDSYGGYGSDTFTPSIQAQRYDAAGQAVGGQFQVNLTTAGFQKYPSVAVFDDGGFVITWFSTDPHTSIRGRVYSEAGAGGSELEINANPVTVSARAPVAVSGGAFFVTWEGRAPDDSSAIQGRLFSDAGVPLGKELRINSYTENTQARPDIAVAPSGGLLVAWASGGSPEDDSGTSVQARWLRKNGFPSGPEFQANTYTPGSQELPGAGVAADGTFVLTWTSFGSLGTDTDNSVQARRYLLPVLFADGFESGDTSGWSTTIP